MERLTASRFWPVATMAGFFLAAQAGTAAAATFVVDRFDDAVGATACTGAANDCSLRGAIIAANASAGADVITVPAGTYTLTVVNAGGVNEDSSFQGDLDINESVTINGAGAGLTIIQAGTTTGNGIDKVIAVNPICASPVAVVINGVTIRHGRNTQAFGAPDFSFTGGGLDFCGTGASSFTLTNSDVSLNTNTDGYGGGINIDEVAPSTSVVTITNTTVTSNTSKFWGGGINIFGDNPQVTITGSTFSANTTLGTAGAGAQGGGLNIRVTNQTDGDGAPVPVVAMGTLTVLNNVGIGFGGGIDVAGSGDQTVTLTDSVISGNVVNLAAGGVTNSTGGGLDHSNNAARTTTLTRVLISNNQSNGGVAGTASNGGGIAHGSGSLIVRNTTVSGNSTKNEGGGVYVSNGPSVTFTNSTIANNRADSDDTSGGGGGSLRNLGAAAAATLQNTISDGNLGTSAAVNEISGLVTANFSLIANITGATITGANNWTGVSGRLIALANNGASAVGPAGFTAVPQTHGLLPASQALDNGSGAFATAAGLTTDQRGTGFPRVLDAADLNATNEVDMGAFEAHPMVEDVLSQAINEDAALSTSFLVGDSDQTSGLDTITVTSSNTTLVPNASINVGGAGSNTISSSTNASQTLVITPAANLSGTTTITTTVTDVLNGTTQTTTDQFLLTVAPVADPPSATNSTTSEDTQTTSGLVLSRNVVDGAEVSHFQITGITNGALFLNDGTTPVVNGNVITFAQGNAGLRFTPAANLFSPGSSFGFNVAGATSAGGAGLSPTAAATITVNPVADTPSVTNTLTAVNIQTTSGLVISRNAADGAEVTHFKITAITNGLLFQNDGSTPIVNGDFITFVQGNAGLRFTPAAAFVGNATFDIQASTSNVNGGLGGAIVTATITVPTPVAPGDLVIREFRLRGMAGAADEYVVIHNKTSSAIVVGATDGSAGFAVASSDGVPVFTIPNGAVIKPKGFFLGVNTAGFSIGTTPDATWATNVLDGLGLALFTTSNPLNFATATPLDAVGVAGGSAPYIEGTGIPSLATVNGQYAWVRKAPTGAAQDTGNNATDFMLVATDGAPYNGVQSILGAPAPTKNSLRDVYSGLTIQMAEPLVGPNLNPNRIRTGAGNSGTLEFRRRITNNTGASITAIRLRVTDLSTFNSPGYSNPLQADLRPGTGPNGAITATSIGVTSLTGLNLMTPPAQAIGGGVNSVLLLPVAPLANGAFIDINIRLNISRIGSYRFFITVEAQ